MIHGEQVARRVHFRQMVDDWHGEVDVDVEVLGLEEVVWH